MYICNICNIYAYIYVYMFVYIYIYIYIYINVYIYVYIYKMGIWKLFQDGGGRVENVCHHS